MGSHHLSEHYFNSSCIVKSIQDGSLLRIAAAGAKINDVVDQRGADRDVCCVHSCCLRANACSKYRPVTTACSACNAMFPL